MQARFGNNGNTWVSAPRDQGRDEYTGLPCGDDDWLAFAAQEAVSAAVQYGDDEREEL